jgi:hypothetical protein
MNQRGIVAQAGRLWRTLSWAQQHDWDLFAKTPPEIDYNSLDEIYQLSGFGWFTRILTRRRRVGLSNYLLAPISEPTAAPITFGFSVRPATGSQSDAYFGFTSGDFENMAAILQLSIAPGKGTNVQTSRYLNLYEDFPLSPTIQYFGISYYAAFGITQVGMRFFGRLFRQAPTGIRSVPKEVFMDVYAP